MSIVQWSNDGVMRMCEVMRTFINNNNNTKSQLPTQTTTTLHS